MESKLHREFLASSSTAETHIVIRRIRARSFDIKTKVGNFVLDVSHA